MIKISKRDFRDLEDKAESDLKHIREKLKQEPIALQILKKHKTDKSIIDELSIQFVKNLDVSAKTVNGKIYLNAEMLKSNWKDYFHYLIHELEHALTHLNGECNGNNEKNVNYLDNPAEIAAFKEQLKYKKKTEPKTEVNKYIKDLFDKHDIPKKERQEKKKELLDK